ncbi:MAG TPA: SET domain-containing protein [Xanthobacteraceae bacterium]
MASRSFRVGRSRTGLGLFAVRAIAKKEHIVAYSGKWITTEEARRRERLGNPRYLFEVNSRWTIDGATRRNLGRYANHSCKPNAEPMLRKGKMLLVATKPISPGDEITFDYGEDYFDYYFKKAGCRCMACAMKPARRTARTTKTKTKTRTKTKRKRPAAA